MLNHVLGVVVGLFFVYLVLSLICSTLVECIARVWSWRGVVLEDWVCRLLGGPEKDGLARRLYSHPLIGVLKPAGLRKKPPYIPPESFTLALTDVLREDAGCDRPSTVAEFRNMLADSPACPPSTRRALKSLAHAADGSMADLRRRIGVWFDDPLGTVAHAYQGKVRFWVCLIAVAVSFGLNLDSVMIARALWEDSELRARIYTAAEETVETVGEEGVPASLSAGQRLELAQELEGLPLWWSGEEGDITGFPGTWHARLLKVLGILGTVIAVSLGASFWFDALRGLLRLGGSDSRRRDLSPAKAGGD
jgi:hypothetical protein